MKRLLLLLFLLLCFTPAFAAKVAILIGCNAYTNFNPLKCCVTDVNTMHDALKAAGYQVNTMTGKELDANGDANIAFMPLKGNIENQLKIWAAEKAYGAGDTLLFFFSGHGVRSLDGLDYLAPLDGQMKADGVDFDSLVPMHLIYEQLRRSGAENIFIITDACRNEPGRGITQTNEFGKGAAKDLTEIKWVEQRVALLRSCAEEQRSYEMPNGAGGYFTYYLTHGLKGEAAKDGLVTVASLCAYVKEQVRRSVSKDVNMAQIPQFTFTNPDTEKIILAGKLIEQHLPVIEQPALGSLRVTSDPPGARVLVGGDAIDGKTPLTVQRLHPGEITVLISLDGFGDVTQTVKILPGEQATMTATLPVLQGAMVVKSTPPGATVILDGAERGVTTADGLKIIGLPIGEHSLKMTLTDYRDEARQVLVTNHGNNEIAVNLTGVPGKVTISTTPNGATVLLDGQESGKSLLMLRDVVPGQHEARVSLPGYASAAKEFILPPNGAQLVSFELVPLEKAQLEVTSDPPGATVYINDVARGGNTPVVINLAEIGEVEKEIKVEARLPGFQSVAKTVTIKAGDQRNCKFQLTKGPQPGQIMLNPKDGAEMIFIPAGVFLMGSTEMTENAVDDEKPQHSVYLDGFFVYKNLVTIAQYRKFCQATGRELNNYYYKKADDDHPMMNVSWEEANVYAVWAGASLPTEAQWEKAARGADGRIYPWGNNWDAGKCWFRKDQTMPVGSFPAGASPYGALDMVGNVWQWCTDWYDENYYPQSPKMNPFGPVNGLNRVLRGGSGGNLDFVDNVACRCAFRYHNGHGLGGKYVGFRCVSTLNVPVTKITTDLTLNITAPEALKNGEELRTGEDHVTVTGYISDEEGVQLTNNGDTVQLGEPSQETRPTRQFSVNLTDLQPGGKYTEEFEVRDAFGRSVKKTLKIRIKSKEPVPGEVRINPKDGAEMVYLPAGEFLMGSKAGAGDAMKCPSIQYIWTGISSIKMTYRLCNILSSARRLNGQCPMHRCGVGYAIIRSSMSPGKMPRPMPIGREPRCPVKRNGKKPRGGRMGESSHGETPGIILNARTRTSKISEKRHRWEAFPRDSRPLA